MKTTWPGFLLGPLGAKVPQTRRFCQKVRTVTPIRFVSKLRFLFGGEGGIRTLDTLVGYTRFPIVRARPGYATSPRSVRVAYILSCQLAYYNQDLS